MHHSHRTAVHRFLTFLGFFIVSTALVVPVAPAGERAKA